MAYRTFTIKQASSMVGTLGEPSKMPCYTYGIPASACHVGGALRKVEGSTCSDCYACKGNYQFPTVVSGQSKRLDSLHYGDEWVDAMVALIGSKKGQKAGYFRWHDSGDLQSLSHLAMIVKVADRLPNVRFWLPTREKAMVRQWLIQFGSFPANLRVRLSATMIDGPAPVLGTFSDDLGTSTVHHKGSPIGFECPAPAQGGKCQDCRACWSADVPNVSYKRH